MNGVLVVDKPEGCTSHDVVQRVRRLLDTRRVGHAGTLDPLATGVLIIAVGEGTKLVPYLQHADKRYDVTIRFGVATDTLDAEGRIVDQRPVPALDDAMLEEAVARLVGTHPQRVPEYSAVKVEGQALHRRARRGEVIDAPCREVTLHSATVTGVDGALATLSLHCGKGFVVRAFARDLGEAIGTVAHVVRLRRTASGKFSLREAVDLEALERLDEPETVLVSLEEACGELRQIRLTDQGTEDARHGRAIVKDRVEGDWPAEPVPLALLSSSGKLVAIGGLEDDRIRITRGLVRDG